MPDLEETSPLSEDEDTAHLRAWSTSPQQPHQLAIIAGVDFAIDQQRHALLEAQRRHAGLCQLFSKAGRQAVQL